MSPLLFNEQAQVEKRARQTLGSSDRAIYETVGRAIEQLQISGESILDVGCGNGMLRLYVSKYFKRYIGVDVVKYEGFPADAEYHQVNLDTGNVPMPGGSADVVASVETIEHLENPRAFLRELVRLVKSNGWILLTTPNQLSFLSLVTLVFRKRFAAFQDCNYPAHITALLETDLKRIAKECELEDIQIAYSLHGRILLTGYHYPKFLSRLFPRLLSDNLLLIARKKRDV